MKGKKYRFKYLRPFNKIIVTGPPRSGTTIAARIIAKELNYKFIDESWYHGNDSSKFWFLMSLSKKLVIQTTGFLKDIHVLEDECRKNAIVVLIKRDSEEILASMRNTLNFENNTNFKYGMVDNFNEDIQQQIIEWYGAKEGNVPDVVYDYFYKNNRRFFEIKYNSLKNHPLWINLEERRKFTNIKQINSNPMYVYEKMRLCQIKQ